MKPHLLRQLAAKSFIFLGITITADAFSALAILAETREGLVYIEQKSIEKKQDTQLVMITQDFHEMQTAGTHEYLSSRSQFEIDCAEKKLRRIRLEIFPLNMAMGGILHEDSQTQSWINSDQGKLQSLIWSAVCVKP